MRGPCCAFCDRGNTTLDERDMCPKCAEEFARVMSRLRCAETSGICSSPFTCMTQKRCVQIRAAVAIVEGEAKAGRT